MNFQPDFEQIRKQAIDRMVAGMPIRTASDRNMAETLAQSASIVASNMLAEYHRQLMRHLERETQNDQNRIDCKTKQVNEDGGILYKLRGKA